MHSVALVLLNLARLKNSNCTVRTRGRFSTAVLPFCSRELNLYLKPAVDVSFLFGSVLNKHLYESDGNFELFCEQGWTMIFKAVSGVSSPEVGHLWNSPLTLSENVNAALDITTKHPGHYKNRIVVNWTTFNPQEVNLTTTTTTTRTPPIN